LFSSGALTTLLSFIVMALSLKNGNLHEQRCLKNIKSQLPSSVPQRLIDGGAWGFDTKIHHPEINREKKGGDCVTMKPRIPTSAEKQELANLLISEAGYEQDEIAGIIESSAVAVFDDYITGGPGYSGKVMVVVWEASPSIFNVYTWNNGLIEETKHEFSA